MQDISELINQFGAMVNILPSPQIPQEVIAFIELMSQAKYSTFLTEEKEAQYHALNIRDSVNASIDFEKSCKASALFNPIVLNYVRSLRTQVLDDFI